MEIIRHRRRRQTQLQCSRFTKKQQKQVRFHLKEGSELKEVEERGRKRGRRKE
jgi:hypothetical protein